MNIILIYFSIKYKGDWDKIYRALEDKEKVTLNEINELEERIKKEKWNLITIIDKDYPEQLKQAYKPPFVIWLKGNGKLLANRFIALTGNQSDEFSAGRIEKFVPEINKSHSIVTASYKGIDQDILSHNKEGSLYILANGINEPYVNSNVKDIDLLISEYPPETGLSKDRLRNRNRIIAAFAKSLVLFTSKKNGPINNLITNFLNLGKEVYCFPGDGSEEDGNSELIKQGANLITGIKDISN